MPTNAEWKQSALHRISQYEWWQQGGELITFADEELIALAEEAQLWVDVCALGGAPRYVDVEGCTLMVVANKEFSNLLPDQSVQVSSIYI